MEERGHKSEKEKRKRRREEFKEGETNMQKKS